MYECPFLPLECFHILLDCDVMTPNFKVNIPVGIPNSVVSQHLISKNLVLHIFQQANRSYPLHP